MTPVRCLFCKSFIASQPRNVTCKRCGAQNMTTTYGTQNALRHMTRWA